VKKLALLILPWLIFSSLLVAACGPGAANTNAVTEEQSRQTALDYVTASPTYTFDGMADTLKLAGGKATRDGASYTFTYEFESRHAGYGDRTGQALAQVITPHQAVITVENGNVTSAVMDGTWDMRTQAALAPANG
jgi:hypothetical protein